MRSKRNLSTNKANNQRKKQLHRQQLKVVNRRQSYFNQAMVSGDVSYECGLI